MKEFDNAWIMLGDRPTFLKGKVRVERPNAFELDLELKEDSKIKEGDLISIKCVLVEFDVKENGNIGDS